VPEKFNVLLNPKHAEAGRIRCFGTRNIRGMHESQEVIKLDRRSACVNLGAIRVQ